MVTSTAIADSNVIDTMTPAELLALLRRILPPKTKPSKPGRPTAISPSY